MCSSDLGIGGEDRSILCYRWTHFLVGNYDACEILNGSNSTIRFAVSKHDVVYAVCGLDDVGSRIVKFDGTEKKVESKIIDISMESVSLIKSWRTRLLIMVIVRDINNKWVMQGSLFSTKGAMLHSAVIHRSENQTNLSIESVLVIHETRACTTLIVFRRFYLIGLIQCKRGKIVVFGEVISNSLRKQLEIPDYGYASIVILVKSRQELHVLFSDQYMKLKLNFK